LSRHGSAIEAAPTERGGHKYAQATATAHIPHHQLAGILNSPTIGVLRADIYAATTQATAFIHPPVHIGLRPVDEGLALVVTRHSSSHQATIAFLIVGVAIGVISTSFFFAHAMFRSRECKPVVDVEYKRTGKNFVAETVARRPVPERDGNRCLLAEAGS